MYALAVPPPVPLFLEEHLALALSPSPSPAGSWRRGCTPVSMVTAMAGGSGGGGGAASSSSGTAGMGLVASADVFVKRSNIPFAGGGAFAARNLPTNDVLFPMKDGSPCQFYSLRDRSEWEVEEQKEPCIHPQHPIIGLPLPTHDCSRCLLYSTSGWLCDALRPRIYRRG